MPGSLTAPAAHPAHWLMVSFFIHKVRLYEREIEDRLPVQNLQKRQPYRPPVRRHHQHHRRQLQKMRRQGWRQRRRAVPRRHPRRRQRQLAVRQRQHRAKARQNPQQRALRLRQNGRRILHLPWRLRMRARRKRG